MSDWLKIRLSPTKDKTDRWTGLASAIQQYWEENFDPIHIDLINLRSIYTMSQPDLALKMREKGDYFSPDWPSEYDQPLAVAWREGEMLRKSTEYIITSTFRRNFKNMGVKWKSLYALKTSTYGESFVTDDSPIPAETLNSDYWLTSRGRVAVDLDSMYSNGYSMVTFSPIVTRIVKKLKPLHIVYDGIIFQWESEYTLEYSSEVVLMSTVQNANISIGFIKRYDITSADTHTTDLNEDALTVKPINTVNIHCEVGMKKYGIVFDEVPLDFTNLDYDFFSPPDDVVFVTNETSTEIPLLIDNRYLKISTFEG